MGSKVDAWTFELTTRVRMNSFIGGTTNESSLGHDPDDDVDVVVVWSLLGDDA